jgi:alanyl-tRNA synthetase
LYDTYGFPLDLTADIARERGLSIDEAGYEAAMEAQRKRGQAGSKFGVDLRADFSIDGKTTFTGYESHGDAATVVALIRGKEQVQSLQQGEEGQIVLDKTPFYAESGGQVGDAGALTNGNARFEVADTLKLSQSHAHVGRLIKGAIGIGDKLQAQVDIDRRNAIRLNHSATHLLHAALRKVLGNHVTQKGSLVAPDRLRFDFSHYSAVTPDELKQIEKLVNDQIRKNAAAETQLMSHADAVASGAMALFGEKYEDVVRVLRIGDFSVELCGGTHVGRAGDIGLFKILSESGVAAGVRRIEAVTGDGALEWVASQSEALRNVAALVKGNAEDVQEKVQQLIDRSRKLEKEVAQLKSKLASGKGSDLSEQAVDVNGFKVVAARVDGADAAALRDAVDQLKNKLKSAAVVLASVDADKKIILIAGVTNDYIARVKAGELVNMVAQQVGGRGGGRPDMAQAGGQNPEQLDAALHSVVTWVSQKLAV